MYSWNVLYTLKLGDAGPIYALLSYIRLPTTVFYCTIVKKYGISMYLPLCLAFYLCIRIYMFTKLPTLKSIMPSVFMAVAGKKKTNIIPIAFCQLLLS